MLDGDILLRAGLPRCEVALQPALKKLLFANQALLRPSPTVPAGCWKLPPRG